MTLTPNAGIHYFTINFLYLHSILYDGPIWEVGPAALPGDGFDDSGADVLAHSVSENLPRTTFLVARPACDPLGQEPNIH